MKSELTIAFVVLVAVAGHVALYRWVKFKVQEGVILKFLREAREQGAANSQHVDAIAAHTEIVAKRVAVVCRKSAGIEPDPHSASSWRTR
ncbi:hypothetical protein EYC98_14285 [Halieaceae bacterium IMCC14734]|uniref:Uncharacterized protein n=1 Tax=Candidatus Litorirhabdus singularis TaxID=2518993 RepID=A0ABT3TI71_9GAMM|nr:hypothetical protein [Candidatus Litorirhabdus singularis]MCX2982028.1 hypothetical protein [Candidatus Litorirhabdus singularis]